MEEWGIQAIQFVWFKESVDGLTAASLFRQLEGEDAESIQNNKNISAALPFLSQAITGSAERAVQVQVAPGRIDYIVGHPDRPSSGPWAWRLSAGLKVVETELSKVLNEANRLGSAYRIAVVLTMLRNVGSQVEASTLVRKSANLLVPDDILDLSYQVNRRMQSKMAGVFFNRLLKFNTSSIQDINFALVNGRPSPINTGVERFVAALQIDVNTAFDGKTLPANDAAQLMKLAAEEAIRIAKIGKIAAIIES